MIRMKKLSEVEKLRFDDQVVIVTGGAKGIGKEIANRFAEEGAKVVIADIDISSAEQTVVELKKHGTEAAAIQTDISKLKDIQQMVDFAVEKFGRLDVLVNNAGIQIRRSSVDFLEADWDLLMSINLKAVFFCSQAAAKVMIPKGSGSIVNIASATCINTTPGRAPYVISKAGVNALTAVLGAEWAPYGVRVNAVSPGWILTDMVQEGMRLGVIKESEILSVTPLRRLAATREIADAVIYLASKEASYVVGHSLFVDGGWSVLGIPQRLEQPACE